VFAEMKCPHCRKAARRIIALPNVDGLRCEHCRPDMPADTKLYTGKKGWGGHEVYTREQLREKAYNYEQTQIAGVKEERRRMRPSVRMALYGE